MEMEMESDVHQLKAWNLDMDDDGKLTRTGTMWTASAHIITSVIGSGILSLAWALAQLGWIAGPAALFMFSTLTLYTSFLLADCYRFPDPVTGTRNYTYMAAVRSSLSKKKGKICGFTQYIYMSGVVIGYAVTASVSMGAVIKARCFHNRGHDDPCMVSTSLFIGLFAICQVMLSQIPSFHKLSILSFIAAIMSIIYATIGVFVSIARIISGNVGKTSLKGALVMMNLTENQRVWRMFRGLGNIAFAFSFSSILIEIEDTLRPPAENKIMKKAAFIGVSVTTLFYALCGCVGYAALGSEAPGNLLTSFGFYEPSWLIDVGNICIVVHLMGAFQVFIQPLYAIVESWAARRWPQSKFITSEYPLRVFGKQSCYSFNMLRMVWRTGYVVLVSVLAMALPFFNDVLAFLGAIGYWPLTVYFPIEMYISQKKIKRFTSKWVALQILCYVCLMVAIAVAIGSIQGMIETLHDYKPFKSKQ